MELVLNLLVSILGSAIVAISTYMLIVFRKKDWNYDLDEIALWILGRALNSLPQEEREYYHDEWNMLLFDQSNGIERVRQAIGLLKAAHIIGFSVRSSHMKLSFQRKKKAYAVGRIIAKDPIEIRVIDIICSFVLLCLFAPIMAIIAISVFIANPGPIIFKQKRIGRYGQIFDCYKFRTMAVDAEARLEKLLASDPKALEEWEQDHKLKNDPRIVGIGSFLRKSSLDELPQFINVLKGEMSLVGKRKR